MIRLRGMPAQMIRVGLMAGVSMLSFTAFTAVAAETAGVEKLETVVVTAQKKSENIQNVPISVSAITAEQFSQSHQADLQALTGSVPNVQIGHFSNTPHGAVFNIRGMGVIEPDPYAGTTVSVVLDDVPQYFNMASLLDLFNVNRIEILRGPQGTLFGANTTGGVINVVTNGPSGNFGGEAQVTVGNYSRVDVDASVDFPIIQDVLAAKISVVHDGRDGFFTNVVNGMPMGSINETNVRGYLKWTPTPNFAANLILEYDRGRDGSPVVVDGAYPTGEAFSSPVAPAGTKLPMYATPCPIPNHRCHAPSQYFSANNGADFSNQDMYALTLRMDWDSPVGALTSITGYRFFGLHEDTDQDGSPVFYDETDRQTRGWQFSQEVRDTFHPIDHVELLVGAFALFDHYTHYQNYLIQFAAPGFRQLNTQNENNWSGSVFAQANVDLTEKLQLQLGIRGSYEATGMAAGITNFDNPAGIAIFSGDGAPLPGAFVARGRHSWDDYAAKVGINYKWTEDLMTYASFSRGFKSGGFVGRITIPTDLGPYGPEHVMTYEGGIKSTWLDGRLRGNLAVFWNTYDDIQLAEIYFAKDPITGVTVNGNSILNAASATTKGVELEVSALPFEGLEVNASAAYLDARYDTFLYADPNLGGAIRDMSGKQMQNAPSWTANAGFKYTFPVLAGEATVGADYRFTAPKYDFSLSDAQRAYIQSTGFFDANVDWTPNEAKWSLGFWVRNLTDRRYIDSVYDAPGVFGLVAYQPPREMGGTLKYHW